MDLDIPFVRANFPAFDQSSPAFFENAGGSFPCRQTVDALTDYYLHHKVQPYSGYAASAEAGARMDRSGRRWAEALGVEESEVSFGPSTSQNTYVLAHAFGDLLGPGDEIIVTNQDHEANTGVFRRMAKRAGVAVREWRVDPDTGLLDPDSLDTLLSGRTRLLTFPHCSNIIGQENDVGEITARAHAAGARVICDGVSYAPHSIPDVGALGPDVYLFSLYKVYSVHQGVMITQNDVTAELPSQAHYFNSKYADKHLTPAGPDHAQIASAGGVLDYVETLHRHHGGSLGLPEAARSVSALWRDHEARLLGPLLSFLSQSEKVRLLGPSDQSEVGHRCPTVAFVPLQNDPEVVSAGLIDREIMTNWGTFYANRVLEGINVDPAQGVVRVSFVHYTSAADIAKLLNALDEIL
jgi:selenocysteine lyase/cysteine desulfurase